MKLFFALILFFNFPAIASAKLDGDIFVKWINGYYARKYTAPPIAKHQRLSIHYVFVAGFLGETNFQYFTDNVRQLTDLGIPRDSIHILYPSSGNTFDEGSIELAEDLKEIPGRLVIFGHSKGALETMDFALRNPEFVEKRVEKIFLVQGPFGGSEVADQYFHKGIAVDDQLTIELRWLIESMRTATQWLEHWIDGGMTSLSSEYSANYWPKLLHDQKKIVSRITDKIFYIRSWKPSARVSPALFVTTKYLETYYGKSDGMVLLAKQNLPGIGTTLTDVDADHFDLTISYPSSMGPRALRTALMTSIVLAVEQTD